MMRDLLLQVCFEYTNWDVFRAAALRDNNSIDMEDYAKYNLHKRQYRLKLEGYYTADSRSMWLGVQHITDYKQGNRMLAAINVNLSGKLNF